ncbi:mandelate racemase/muconate lactonizing enzyme family protein [Haloarchaeobius sp. HRN-SO-5]|uniref:mandelate racemase/muconate lactonizing enzyme family protein n=1 Tax=Haloarchaeobius sp. HRN-SO-5 TaxID=3446118 RepID=UPI003EBE121D
MTVVDAETLVLDNDTGSQSLPTGSTDLEVDIRTVLLRLETDDGHTGLGASFHHAASLTDTFALAKSVEALAEHVVGEDADPVRGHWHELYDTVKRSTAFEALSVVDQALWDVKGKRADLPLYQLLGGTTGDLRAYATFPHAKAAEELVADAEWLADAGFEMLKIVAGFGPREDRERIEAVAPTLPADFGLAIDANTSYDFGDALAVARTASEHDLRWFEEPIAHTDVRGIADLRSRVSVPIAGYQTQTPHYPAVDHLREDAYDVYQPSLYHVGGVTAAMNVATLVEAFNKTMVPHAVGPAVNYAASLHVAAAAPACSLVEFAVFDDEADDPREFVASPYVANQDELSVSPDGTISPPERPGLGVILDEDAVEEYRVEER